MAFKLQKTSLALAACASLLAVLLAAARTQGASTRQASIEQQHNTRVAQPRVLVQTTSGLLSGFEHTPNESNSSSSVVYKFLSVPYALPPIGALRFKRPVELTSERALTQVDASKQGPTCPQFRHLARFISPLLSLDGEHQTSEDCLHLNLFVPTQVSRKNRPNFKQDKLEPTERLPVIVWLPGEGFDYGDARQFDATHLAQQTHSVVVTVQYRVGVLGFLRAPHLGVQGNMGLHDQLAALRWIRANIGAFGGDYERVTLMGRFSGSMSVSALLTAPNESLVRWNRTGAPLFSRAALLSGIAVQDWTIEQLDERESRQRVALMHSKALERGLCNSSGQTVAECLQALPVEELLLVGGRGWKLAVDGELVSHGGPIEALRNRHLLDGVEAVLLGETDTEGTLCLYRHLLQADQSHEGNNYARLIEHAQLTSESLYEMIDDDARTYFKYNVTESDPVRQALAAIVSGRDEATQETSKSFAPNNLRQQYLDACSAYMVKAHTRRFKRHLAQRNRQLESSQLARKPVEIYQYELKYKPSFSLAPDYVQTAAHGDDVPLIFGLLLGQPRAIVQPDDLIMTRKMMSYVGNFVHGNHPLLQQHAPLSGAQEQPQAQLSEPCDEPELDSTHKRNWLSGDQVHELDLGDHTELRRQSGAPEQAADELQTKLSKQQQQAAKQNQLDLSGPMAMDGAGQPAQVLVTRSQNLLDLYKQQQQQQPLQSHQLVGNDLGQYAWLLNARSNAQLVAVPQLIWAQLFQAAARRSANSLELPGETSGELVVATAPNGPQQTPVTSDSYLMSALLIGACAVIFALASFCIVLSMIVFRYNLAKQTNQMDTNQKRFDSSTSTCNICDESQHGGLEAVLNVTGANHANCQPGNQAAAVAAARKEGQNFCNVFAKLRHHAASAGNEQQRHQQQPMAPTLFHSDQRTTNGTCMRRDHLQAVDGLVGAQKLDQNGTSH